MRSFEEPELGEKDGKEGADESDLDEHGGLEHIKVADELENEDQP